MRRQVTAYAQCDGNEEWIAERVLPGDRPFDGTLHMAKREFDLSPCRPRCPENKRRGREQISLGPRRSCREIGARVGRPRGKRVMANRERDDEAGDEEREDAGRTGGRQPALRTRSSAMLLEHFLQPCRDPVGGARLDVAPLHHVNEFPVFH